MEKKTVLITGGAGFIGINTAKHFIEKGYKIIILDDLSRIGSESNLQWLQQEYKFEFIQCDMKDYQKLTQVFKSHKIDLAIHLAAQVAVTLSVSNPRHDLETNILGSFNLLESIRNYQPECVAVYASTNKVYGDLEHLEIEELEKRYILKNHQYGIDENTNLDFHSPYGCSKGCADQYFLDYNRIYGIQTVVMRQSCIYGPRQFGVEDQGWLAWFLIAIKVLQRNITIFGNGKQVRDILYVVDLAELYEKAYLNISNCKGNAYNIGGGAENTLSLIEFLELLQEQFSLEVKLSYAETRSGDQKIFIADLNKVKKDLNWMPKTSKQEGLVNLHDWIKNNEKIIKDFFIAHNK